MNSVPNISKLDKLIFSYNLFDEEDIRVIPIDELKLILQANYFAEKPNEMDKKAEIIMRQAISSAPGSINYDDYIDLGKKFSAMFYPVNL